jgi:Retron-type reverse transcriptase
MIDIDFASVYDYENLYQSFILSARQKHYRTSVLEFSYSLEENLIEIQNELIWKTYKVSAYRHFMLHEPKERLVSALPFKDRIIQHALCNVIEPVFESRMINDSHACRKGHGTLTAANRLSYFMGKESSIYYLKCDVRKYFASVKIPILKDIVKKWYIQNPDILWLLFSIYDAEDENDGLKIGNLTSQLSANVYLTELDFLLKTKLQVKNYIRYMDDFIILDKSKAYLNDLLATTSDFLDNNLGLQLNDKTHIGLARDGIDFVGFKIFPRNKVIKKASMNRMRGKYNAWKHGKMSDDRYLASIGSWIGHAKGTSSTAYVENTLLKSLRVAINRDRPEPTSSQACPSRG